MSKRIALKDYIECDGHDLSPFFRSIGFSSEHAKVDASGFNATGTDEFLAGNTTQGITGEVFGAYGASESWDILYRLHRDRTVFAIKWRPDSSAAVSATNPQLEGNVQLLSWQGGANRGEVEAFPVEFTPADSTGLAYVTT